MRKTLKVLVSAVLALILTVGAACTRVKPEPVPERTEGNYNALPAVDWAQYTAFRAVTNLLGVDDVLAFYKDSAKAYYRAGLIDTDGAVLTETDGGLVINESKVNALLGRTGGSDAVAVKDGTEIAGLTATVYGKKMVVLTKAEKAPDTFNDMYTLEYLALLLYGSEEDDVLNAFIQLPYSVTNGSNTVFYTAPDLNLGLQTNVYYAQLGESTVPSGPEIVAGQGNHPDNYTLVRVFNRQQAISAQFLAFPSDVRGGVRVSAVTYSVSADEKETLIATAAFVNSGTGANTVRIFDTNGVIRAAFVPEGIEAPYVILSGKFIEGSSDEYLAVASAQVKDGRTAVNIYSLSDMTLRNTLDLELSGTAAGETVEFSRFGGSANDGIIMYFAGSRKAFLADPVKGEASVLNIELPENATGVYENAYGEDGLCVTVLDGTFSHIQTYGAGQSSGSEINVGWRENRYYSTYAANNPDGYVDKGTFHHVRTDLAAPVVSRISKNNAQEKLTSPKTATFKNWTVKFNEATTYHNGYHMWEPCFTHRWNVNGATNALVSAVDEDGNALYASIGRDNVSGNYTELTSSFNVGTYADGLLEMAKMRLYPLRTYLRTLAIEFRSEEKGEPEKLIAVSPVHEQEINVAGSVGDYNVKMIRGFREYMLSLYGTLENINKRFGTDFATLDDFDAPRYDPAQDDPSKCRGKWDTYGQSDFFTQWSLYTRYIVNKRIMEAYREALLAGFPPEAINAHQIPEGEAVSGFLGEADTRLSPIEAVTVCGTAYGGTRYGLFYNKETNFINQAYLAGHKNITLGEYGSLALDWETAFQQIDYMFRHGVRFTHMINPYDPSKEAYAKSTAAEQKAIKQFQKKEEPRTVETGITYGMAAYSSGSRRFNIVQMSDPSESGGITTGLLKSINENGDWEGTVYLVPFHANVEVKNVSVKGSLSSGYKTAEIPDLQCGDQVELTFDTFVTGEGEITVTVKVYNGGCLMEYATTQFAAGSGLTPCRYVLSNQLTLENVVIEVTFSVPEGVNAELSNMNCTAQYENIAHKYFGDMEAAPALGGVTFDIIGE